MKKWLILWLMVSSAALLPALQIHIAPFAYIDETEDRVIQRTSIHVDFLRELQGIETGPEVQFTQLRFFDINAPQSIIDAVKVCREEHADYLLYGYVSKKDYTLTAEIKLLEYESRSILQLFYAVDDHEHYERLIHDAAYKILAYIDDTFHLETLEKKPIHSWFTAPVTLGYWTPLERKWTDLLAGTIALDGGIRYVPTDRLFTAYGINFYLSYEGSLGYRLGIGDPNAYRAFANSIRFTIPLVRLHAKITEQHNIFAGFGLLYSLDLMPFQELYAEEETKIYNTFGLVWSLGYSYSLNDKYRLLFDNQFDVRFFDTPMASYSLKLGIDILVKKKEVLQKW
jgi:hypothetical protein